MDPRAHTSLHANEAQGAAPVQLLLQRVRTRDLRRQAGPVPRVVRVGARRGPLQRSNARRGKLELPLCQQVCALTLAAALELLAQDAVLDTQALELTAQEMQLVVGGSVGLGRRACKNHRGPQPAQSCGRQWLDRCANCTAMCDQIRLLAVEPRFGAPTYTMHGPALRHTCRTTALAACPLAFKRQRLQLLQQLAVLIARRLCLGACRIDVALVPREHVRQIAALLQAPREALRLDALEPLAVQPHLQPSCGSPRCASSLHMCTQARQKVELQTHD